MRFLHEEIGQETFRSTSCDYGVVWDVFGVSGLRGWL